MFPLLSRSQFVGVALINLDLHCCGFMASCTVKHCDDGSVLLELTFIATLYCKRSLIRFNFLTADFSYPSLISFFFINVLESSELEDSLALASK